MGRIASERGEVLGISEEVGMGLMEMMFLMSGKI